MKIFLRLFSDSPKTESCAGSLIRALDFVGFWCNPPKTAHHSPSFGPPPASAAPKESARYTEKQIHSSTSKAQNPYLSKRRQQKTCKKPDNFIQLCPATVGVFSIVFTTSNPLPQQSILQPKLCSSPSRPSADHLRPCRPRRPRPRRRRRRPGRPRRRRAATARAGGAGGSGGLAWLRKRSEASD